MRITQRQLRQIIREELARGLDEMAYKGMILGPGGKDVRFERNPYRLSTRHDPDIGSRLMRSKKFHNDALRLYANIPYGVWIAPFFGDQTPEILLRSSSEDEDAGRITILDLAVDGIERLRELNYEGVDQINPIEDLVILIKPNTGEGTFTSAWMTFHAVFDSLYDDYSGGVNALVPGYDELFNFLEPGMFEELEKCLTMGAARDGEIVTETDLFAEMMCQELLDKRGLHFDFESELPTFRKGLGILKGTRFDDQFRGPTSEEMKAKILQLGERVKELTQTFRENARGKLIVVRDG